jgi:glycerate kinase
MGGGLMAFLNAELRSGADWLLSLCRFEERISGAELMITGEGRIDRQSLMGKIPGKVLQMGQMHHIPVMALAGCVEDEWLLIKAGFQSVYAAKPKAMPLEKAMERETAVKNLREAAIKAMLAYNGR